MSQPLRIGIVGGGQLGKMLTLSAKKMGFFVAVSDPTPQSPAGQVADIQIIGDYKDDKTIRKLASICDVITFEIELANTRVLTTIQKKGKKVYPSPKVLSIIQDKLKQKEFLLKNKIKTAAFSPITTREDIILAAKKFGYPLLLKARLDAYDGRGNALIRSQLDIKKGTEKLAGRLLYVEKFVPFVKEIAVMIARNQKGKAVLYPVVETIHKDNICDTVIAPAKISKKARTNAIILAKKVVKKMNGVGVFGIEMFLKKDDNVLVNEIAPRVHNSGHYTIEACITSQFEQHIRAITNLPLGETSMIVKASVMKNILGERNGPGTPLGIEKALKIPGVSFHLYGKKESRVARKMGHLTAVGDSVDVCFSKVNRARKALLI